MSPVHEVPLGAGVIHVELRNVAIELPPPQLEREMVVELQNMETPRLCFLLHAIALELKARHGALRR